MSYPSRGVVLAGRSFPFVSMGLYAEQRDRKEGRRPGNGARRGAVGRVAGDVDQPQSDEENSQPLDGIFLAGWAREASSGLVGTARKDGEKGERKVIVKRVRKGDVAGKKDHKKVHRKVIVIKGDNEEEVRDALKEHGIELEFEFESRATDIIFGRFFEHTCNTLVDSFIQQAARIYAD